MTRLRIGAVLAVLGLLVALPACSSGTPAPDGGGGGLTGSGNGTGTVAPAMPWATACTYLGEADVLAATSGHHTTITVVDKKETNDTLGGGRHSECRYNTKGVEQTDGGSIESSGDNWVILNVQEKGASLAFPPTASKQRVAGVGDDAFWDGSESPILHVRVGDSIFTFASYAPVDDSQDDINAGRREVSLKVAQIVIGRLH